MGRGVTLKDVIHVPDIHLSLISIVRLDGEGFVNSFDECKWKLTKGSLIVAKGKNENTFYVMEAKLHKGETNAAQRDVSIELWHRRLGLINEKGFQTLFRKQFLSNLLGMPLKNYDHCLVRKAHRVAFHTYSQSRRPNVIDFNHTDVCTMETRTVGVLYFVTFTDDHSRNV